MTGSNVVPVRPASVVPSVSFADMQRLAESICNSGLFGMKTADQALALMAIAQAEGRHPALAARDYSIIQGRAAKNAEAMLRDFLESGGRVEWHELTDKVADATFSHPAGGSVRVQWDMQRAQQAGLGGKDNWRKYPRQMLRSRVVSEGVRTVCPMATSGMYVPEEVMDFEPMRDVTPRSASAAPAESERDATSTASSRTHSSIGSAAPIEPPHDPETGEIGPHDLPWPDGMTVIDWGGRFIAGVKTAATQREIDEWIERNDGRLADIEERYPKAWRSIDSALASQRAKLGPDEPDMLGPDDTDGVLTAAQ